MTAHDPNDLRDARLDAAWRAASREEPPSKLDDAIRAAARREIGAGPRPADARMAVPESLRPERWWWPLAAAATIGAIAIGILQIGEPDHVGVPGAEKTTVSDTPAIPEQAKKQEAVAPVEADAARQAPAAKPAAPLAPPAATPPSAARDRVAPAPPPPPASPPAPKALRKDVAVPFPREEGAAARNVSPSSASEPRSAANAAANAATPAPVAQPFPADTEKRESKETAMRDAAPAVGAVAPSPAPPADASKPGVAEGKLATAPAEPAREAQRSGLDGAQHAQPRSAGRRMQEAEDARGFAPANASKPQAQATVATREKVAAKLPVPDWIALIRKLRDEGKADEAAKELAAFRNAHADHEQILPPDLRNWKPAAR